jgi:hypothetical protein
MASKECRASTAHDWSTGLAAALRHIDPYFAGKLATWGTIAAQSSRHVLSFHSGLAK